MDEYSRRALVDMCKELAGDSDLADLHLEDRLARLELLETLDGIFDAFMKTNLHMQRHYSLDEILALTGKCFFRYEHFSVPYRGTVTTIRDEEAEWRCIKLANNGFLYTPKAGARVSRHKYRTWTPLGFENGLQQFQKLQQATAREYGGARAFYTFEERRVDIKLYPKRPGTVHLMITWEDGYPDHTTSAARVAW